MSLLPLALSLSSTFTKIGAIAAFAALVGIALLALLVFSQARELKRLREWAGRAPERAAELEQRVTASAAMRVQPQAPGAYPQGHGPPARAAPSGVPIQAPAAAAAAAAAPATRVAGVPGAMPATPAVPGAMPATPGMPSPVPVAASGAPSPIPPAPGVPPPATGTPRPPSGLPGTPATPMAVPTGRAVNAGGAPATPLGAPVSAAGVAQSRPLTAGPPTPTVADPRAPVPPPPATAAASAAASASAPPAVTPASAASAPPSAAPPSAAPPNMAPASAAPAASAPPSAAPRVPAAAAGTPARLPPPPAPPPGTSLPSSTQARAASAPPLGERSVYAARPAPRRARVLVLLAGAAVVAGAVAAIAIGAVGGSSHHGTASNAASVRSVHGRSRTHAHHATAAQTPAVSPAETSVVVLNATEVEGLAHRTASALQQSGYSQATALSGRPPGSGQVSVVEYVSGHQAEAGAVARSLGIAHVLPIEAGVTALAGSANVVVIVGADRAGQNP
ncbi:MAG TPA: LytR C-terminal domain-containing protein [Solirubrobacteraceae bacterium]|nr:LytR C-terminal domain-containing protein [Solirubrobacteraceae bacterium]